MADRVPFTRLRYHADYSSLTKRMGFPVRHYAMYRKNPPKKTERHALKRATYFPKYSHYLNRKSNLSIYPESEYIKTYKKPIHIFAIQDSFSRFIVHACLKEQTTNDFTNLPWWYDVVDCFHQVFDTYGRPFEMVVDRHVGRRYREVLEDNCKIVTGATHPAYSASLERFFLSVQYEMRTDLSETNFNEYVHFYNFERPHSALNGYSPASAWLTGSKERFEAFQKNSRDENKEKLFAEIRHLVESNYVQR